MKACVCGICSVVACPLLCIYPKTAVCSDENHGFAAGLASAIVGEKSTRFETANRNKTGDGGATSRRQSELSPPS